MKDTSQVYGTRIGSYLGKPIYETIQNQEGVFMFDRIARCIDNEYPLDQLRPDELLIEPGLIYRSERSAA